MNTKSIVWIVIAIVVIGVILYAVAAPKDPEPNNPQAQVDFKEAGTFEGSFAELAARGGNYTCTFDQKTDTSETEGTIYISGANIRGEYKTEVDQASSSIDAKVESNMIQKDGFIYGWSPSLPQGFKFSLAAAQNTSASVPASAKPPVDLTQKFKYTCKDWNADMSKFELPSGVTFR
ncbi:MAG: hypothetical protein V4526_01090 [Patescibacteria group bacterium]